MDAVVTNYTISFHFGWHEVPNVINTWMQFSNCVHLLASLIYCSPKQHTVLKGSHLPFNAMTLLAGFMMAESAEIGLLMGLVGSDMSMMTT